MRWPNVIQRTPCTTSKKGDQQALINALQEDVSYQDMVLLKASHGLHLENVLAALLDGDRG